MWFICSKKIPETLVGLQLMPTGGGQMEAFDQLTPNPSFPSHDRKLACISFPFSSCREASRTANLLTILP
jgi:hypothetical protein